jgi:hypothetical protein
MLQVRNWAKFQHYKDRNPPWIKLETSTFQNPEFAHLPAASKLLAICIWTLASRSSNGTFGVANGTLMNDFDYVIRWGFLIGQVKFEHFEELVKKGFVIASSSLSPRYQVAIPEERRGEDIKQEKKTNKRKSPELPEWVPVDNWNAFVEMRKRLHAPLTDRGKVLIFARLNTLRSTDDPGAVLDQSIMNSWKGVFPLSGNGRRTSAVEREAKVGVWDGTISQTAACYRCGCSFQLENAVQEIFCSETCAASKPGVQSAKEAS